MKSYRLALPFLLSISMVAAAAELEHPVIKPIDGFVPRPGAQQKVANYDQFRFRRTDAQGHSELYVKKGKFWNLDYHKPMPDGSEDRSFSRIEIVDNYVAAVNDAGGTILYNYEGELQFSIPRPDGGITYARLMAWNGRYELQIIDEKPLERNLEFTSADDMFSGLEADGFVVGSTGSTSTPTRPSSRWAPQRPSRRWSSSSRPTRSSPLRSRATPTPPGKTSTTSICHGGERQRSSRTYCFTASPVSRLTTTGFRRVETGGRQHYRRGAGRSTGVSSCTGWEGDDAQPLQRDSVHRYPHAWAPVDDVGPAGGRGQR